MPVIQNVNPATGEVLSEIPCASADEVLEAVRRARAAQPAWAQLTLEERSSRLRAAARGLEAAAEELADLATKEMGKVRAEALGEVKHWSSRIPDVLEEVAVALEPQVIDAAGAVTHIERDPLGVVAAITPWNFPVGMPLTIVIPALATGNTVVLKPSEHVPLCGARLAEILGAELPEGVLNVVQGAGDVGARLVEADVDMIGFVGSRETGMRIMAAASRGLKRIVLELGGKDPLIVFPDADLDAAADCAVRHALRNTGQVCCSIERIYVAEQVADEFERKVVEKARAWRHGDGFEKGVAMGPMVSAEQRDVVVQHVEDAVQHGARLLLGGETPEGPGWFYPATVLADVDAGARMQTEETFGPVVSLSRFSGGEEEAVELANATEFGLGANVYTRDPELGLRVARRIRSGQVGVNQYLGSAPGTPWVGARQSGFGFLGGVEGHRQFTVPKSISVLS